MSFNVLEALYAIQNPGQPAASPNVAPPLSAADAASARFSPAQRRLRGMVTPSNASLSFHTKISYVLANTSNLVKIPRNSDFTLLTIFAILNLNTKSTRCSPRIRFFFICKSYTWHAARFEFLRIAFFRRFDESGQFPVFLEEWFWKWP